MRSRVTTGRTFVLPTLSDSRTCKAVVGFLMTGILYHLPHFTAQKAVTTPWSRVLEKLTVNQIVKKYPNFIEPQSSLPCSQGPAIGFYPEPGASNP